MNTFLVMAVGFWVGWRARHRALNSDDVLILCVVVVASSCRVHV